jgi:hypothetical protein
MEKYNGYTNYATWRVMLEMFDGFEDFEVNIDAEYCKEYADDWVSNSGSGLTLDYARAFLSEVNWREIADNINENKD